MRFPSQFPGVYPRAVEKASAETALAVSRKVPSPSIFPVASMHELTPSSTESAEPNASPRRGIFVSFEGSEGCGKSTQVSLFNQWVCDQGLVTTLTREPGGTRAGDSIRHLLQHAPEGHGLCAASELFLFAASRAQLVHEVIQPSLSQGKVVICDRFHDSTAVYQGVARQLDPVMVKAINSYAIGTVIPDITFLLDMEARAAFHRLEGRSLDRMESEPIAFYESVRKGYLQQAAESDGRIVVVDASQDESDVAGAIRKIFQRRFRQVFSHKPDVY